MEQGNKIILVLGILAIAAGIFVLYDASSFQKKAVLTDGKVVHVIGSSYRIQYSVNDGTVKTYQGSGKTHGFHEGDSVSAWYSIKNPDRVRFSDGKKGARTLFIAGVFCIILGVYPLFQKKKDESVSQ
jgi:hypothetical protein